MIAGALEDQRLRRLARRIIFFERPELLSKTARSAKLQTKEMGLNGN